jgi:hypothetical protein
VGKTKGGEDIFCGKVARLRVVLPELNRLGYFTALTTSTLDIISLDQELAQIAALAGEVSHNRIAGIPLLLRRVPRMISAPKGKNSADRIRVKKWLLHIEVDPIFVELALQATQQLSSPAILKMLTNGEEKPLEADVDLETEEAAAQQLEGEIEAVHADQIKLPFAASADRGDLRSPEAIRQMIVDAGEGRSAEKWADTHFTLLRNLITAALDGDAGKADTVLHFVLGMQEDKSTINTGEALAALKDWLKVTDWKAPLTDSAAAEIRNIASSLDWKSL